MPGDTVHLVLPSDPRYVDIVVATVATLADRAGVDPTGITALEPRLHDVLGDRMAACMGATVSIGFEIGDGYLGLRFDGDTS